MYKFSMFALLVVLCCISGCATVSLERSEVSARAKEFASPPSDKSGLYIYRSTILGQAIKKDIWVDGECVGESANDVFFYHEVSGDSEHTIATESEFSPNELKIMTKGGMNYFIRQYLKFGLFVGGANLEIVDPETAKVTITDLDMAVGGNCSRPNP